MLPLCMSLAILVPIIRHRASTTARVVSNGLNSLRGSHWTVAQSPGVIAAIGKHLTRLGDSDLECSIDFPVEGNEHARTLDDLDVVYVSVTSRSSFGRVIAEAINSSSAREEPKAITFSVVTSTEFSHIHLLVYGFHFGSMPRFHNLYTR